MALIKCPSCNQKISDKAPSCSHCGFSRKGASSDDILRKQRLNKFFVHQRIQTQSMLAMLMFVGGFAGWKIGDPDPNGWQVKLSIGAIVVGFFWYIFNRVRLIWLKRKGD